MIEIHVEIVEMVNIARLTGEIDAVSAVIVQEKVLPLAAPSSKTILDMTNVVYMSSAGLRMLLSIYRHISSNQGKVVLVGLSDELKDTMSMTGFLAYFIVQDTLETGLQAFG
jgi:anti-sigma B factor antagonist